MPPESTALSETSGMSDTSEGSAFFPDTNSGTSESDGPWESKPLGDGLADDTPPAETEAPDASEKVLPPEADGDDGGIGGGEPAAEDEGGDPAGGESDAMLPASQSISEADIGLARIWGLSDEQIAAFPNPAALREKIGEIVDKLQGTAEAPDGAQPPNAQQQQPQQQPQGQQQYAGDGQQLYSLMSRLTPQDMQFDLSKVESFADLADEAQGVFTELNQHYATLLHEVGMRASSEIDQLKRALSGMTTLQDHQLLRQFIGGIDDDLKEVVGDYTGYGPESAQKLEAVRQMVMRLPANVPIEAKVRTVLSSLHAKEAQRAAQAKRAKALGANQRALGAHAVGPGSSRKSAASRKSQVNQVDAIKGILEKHGCR
jgi:hypothetical protein